jgi:hypothetical protein
LSKRIKGNLKQMNETNIPPYKAGTIISKQEQLCFNGECKSTSILITSDEITNYSKDKRSERYLQEAICTKCSAKIMYILILWKDKK